MSILNVFDHPGKKQNKEYFVQLVRSAKADDIIHNSELELLHRIGTKLGFTEPEIVNLIAETDKYDYIPPYELAKRFEQVYEVVGMVMADGKVDDNEKRLVTGFAVKSGFSDEEIPALISMLISGKKEGKDEEDLFDEYKKARRTGLK
jgi:uncharacterized tellurite resistance protein B-like protein